MSCQMSNMLCLDHRGRTPLPEISIPDGSTSVVKTFHIDLSPLSVLEVEIHAEHDNACIMSSRVKGPFSPMLLTVYHNDTALCWYVLQVSVTNPQVFEGYRRCTHSGWLPSPPSWKDASIQISSIGSVPAIPVSNEWQKKPNQLSWKHALEGKDGNVEVVCGGRSFLCDRMVLRAHSEVFGAQLDFTQAAAPSDSKVPLKASRIALDAHPLVFLLVMKAMYVGCDEAWRLYDVSSNAYDRMWKEPRGFAVWADVMRLAERYDIPVVRKGVRDVLRESLSAATFNIAGELVREIPDEKLFDAMCQLLKTQTTAALASQLWGTAKDLDDVKRRTEPVRGQWLDSVAHQMTKEIRAGDKRKVPVAAVATASASASSPVYREPQTASQLYDSAQRAWDNGASPDTIIDAFCRYTPPADGSDFCVFAGDHAVTAPKTASAPLNPPPAVAPSPPHPPPAVAADAVLPPAPKKPKL